MQIRLFLCRVGFYLAYAVLIHGMFPVGAFAQTRTDDKQDAAAQTETIRQDAQIVQTTAKVDAASEQLALLNAKNAFWLQVLQTVMPILSAIGIGVVGWLQIKAARERALMAQSIDGLKTELVATKFAAGFFEGAKLEADRHAHPEITPDVIARGQQIADDARKATEAATVANGHPTVSTEALTLKPGETAVAKATKSETTVKKNKP